jgi:hypothetical protein
MEMKRGTGKRLLVVMVLAMMVIAIRQGYAEEKSATAGGGGASSARDKDKAKGDDAVTRPKPEDLESMKLAWIYEGNRRRLAYVVQSGDTLWDIAGKYLNSNYYWPKIWERNTFIVNPHLIFPGDLLYIYPDGVVEVPPVRPKECKPGDPGYPDCKTRETKTGITYKTRDAEGFVDKDTYTKAGKILDNKNNKVEMGENDIVYVNVGKLDKVIEGEILSVFRLKRDINNQKIEEVHHPISGDLVGYQTVILGDLKITKVLPKSSEAIIINSYQEIRNGDLITAYIPPLELVSGEKWISQVGVKTTTVEDLRAYVIANKNSLKVMGNNDVVYIDKGADDGVGRGNVFTVYKPCQLVEDKVSKEFIQVPEKILGHAIVLDTRKKTCTAIITDATSEIMNGDMVLLSKFNRWEIEGVSSSKDINSCQQDARCKIVSSSDYAAGKGRPFCIVDKKKKTKTDSIKPKAPAKN